MKTLKTINAGTEAYWCELREAYALISEVRRQAKALKSEPQYISGGYDDHGDVRPVENMGPFDRFDQSFSQLQSNVKALSILRSQNVRQIGIWPVDFRALDAVQVSGAVQ